MRVTHVLDITRMRLLPFLQHVFRTHKRSGGGSWRMDETYITVNGVWKYLSRAVDKEGTTVDGLLRAKRLFGKALRESDVPEQVTMDKSGANNAAIAEINANKKIPIMVRQVKYLNNIVEQDHRAIKRVTKPMRGVQSVRLARTVLDGIDLTHMIRTGQLMIEGGNQRSCADQFWALAGYIRPGSGSGVHARPSSMFVQLTRQNRICSANEALK